MDRYTISTIEDNVIASPQACLGLAGMAEVVRVSTWSPATFVSGKRRSANFEASSLVVLDVDGGIQLDEALAEFEGYAHLIGTTRNHRKDKNGVTADRFRVVLTTSQVITTRDEYEATLRWAMTKWPFADEQCKDAARQFFPCQSIVSLVEDGQRLEPVSPGQEESDRKTTQTVHQLMVELPRPPRAYFGEEYLARVVSELEAAGFRSRVPTPQVARYVFCEMITGLRRGTAGLSQVRLAAQLGLSQRGAGKLLARLCKLDLLKLRWRGTSYSKCASEYELGTRLKDISIGAKPEGRWEPGRANESMLADIRWCRAAEYTQDQAVAFLLERQGERPAAKMRSEKELKRLVFQWWKRTKGLQAQILSLPVKKRHTERSIRKLLRRMARRA